MTARAISSAMRVAATDEAGNGDSPERKKRPGGRHFDRRRSQGATCHPLGLWQGEDGMDTRTILKTRMHTGSQRFTRQRMIILDELKKVTSHPSAREVYRMVQRRIPNISFGTVYRNLKLLEGLGLIQELNYGKASSRYDGMADNHYHISCTGCGRVDDISMGIRRRLDKEAANASCYDVKAHRIEFYGLCPKCRRGRRR